jgi:sugar lactone lactonase YvrE
VYSVLTRVPYPKLYKTGAGKVIVKGTGRVAELDGDRVKPIRGLEGYFDNFAVGADGTIAAGDVSSSKIKVRTPDGKVTSFSVKYSLQYGGQERFQVDGSGRVWAATTRGLIVIANGRAQYLPTGTIPEISSQVDGIYFMGQGAEPAGLVDQAS